MSNQIFPVLAGQQWDVKKKPEFNNTIQEAPSGAEQRAMWMIYPRWNFELSYDILRAGSTYLELQNIMGFFLARNGDFDSFLYTDPSDNSVTAQQIGVGDGNTTQFQLLRTMGGQFVEPITAPNSITGVYLNGVATSAYTGATLASGGALTFTSPPANGAAITWTGTYYFRCRFLESMAEFNNFMYQLWDLKKLGFKSLIGETS